MTTERIINAPSGARFPRNVALKLSTSAITIAGILLLATPARAQGAGYDDEDAEVLTRGPVHEAFATVVDYNPGRGLVTRQRPPEPIEELPPEEMPEGDDVAWIPGYWAWDDEQSDYIWISGTWRVPPPGREWVPGYWADSEREFIWISGYWAEIETRETAYLPPPPESLERGPGSDRPSLDYGWTPGSWIWQRGDYVWRPGHWTRGRGDWVWIPSYYVWTPHGYIFIDGYWDYIVRRRGIVYAPVRFHSRTYARRGYSYSPRIVFNIGIFSDHLFLRPRWCHYYFGDYYAPRYADSGFYFTFSYHNSWRGYDPFYSYWRWENRRERDWDRRYQASYHHRRDNEDARPPRTWASQVAIVSSTTTTTQNRMIVAGTTAQVTSTRDFPTKFRRVSNSEREQQASRGKEIRATRDQRSSMEMRAPVATKGSAASMTEPARLTRPKSPITGKPARGLSGNLAPPRTPKAPKPDPKVQARSAAQAAQQSEGGQDRATARPRGNRPAETPSRGAAETQARDARATPQTKNTESRAKATEPRSPDTAVREGATQSVERPRNDQQTRANRDAEARERAETARSPAQARERAAVAQKSEQQAAARREKELETRAQSERQAKAKEDAAARERPENARSQAQANERAAAAQKSEQQAVARRAQEANERAQREAQASEQRAAEQQAGAAQAQAKAEADRRAAEAGAQREDRSQKKEMESTGGDQEDPKKKEKGNGMP